MVSPDSLGTACPLSGRNSTYRPVQISGTGSNIARVIDEVIGTAGQLAEKNKNRLVVDSADDLGQLTADPRRLKQILLNLLSNASKFTISGAGGCGQVLPRHAGRLAELA
jgi:signal transduction histidine kinase